MKLRSSKAACCFGVVLVLAMGPVLPTVTDAKSTYEQHESTITDTEIKVASFSSNVEDHVSLGYQEEHGAFYKKALAVSEPYLEVFTECKDDADVAGRLYSNTLVDILEVDNGWTKISSGNCMGYVPSSSLLFEAEAEQLAEAMEISEFLTGYTLEEAEIKEAEEEAARQAELERLAAEAEAARLAEEARIQAIIDKTVSGTDFTYNPTMSLSNEEIYILACIIDWEAAYQPYEGKLAVANVVLNRLRSSRYPNSVSAVVYQRSQFSGASDGAGGPSSRFQARLNNGPRNDECMTAALEALSGKNNVGNYTAFRTVASANINAMSDFMIIGDHVFY
ncbi:MAG: cell wall hydrolase [Eubacteriales bacterium]|nr:cell wall hydrolase [Eubacteriales bacterium]